MYVVVGGLAMGAVYAMVAIGLVLIFRATGILNFAQGEMLMVGAYAYLLVSERLSSPLVQVGSVVGAAAIAGLIFYGIAHVLLRRAEQMHVVIGTLGLMVLLQAGSRFFFSDYPQPSQPWIFGDQTVPVGESLITLNSLVTIALVISVTVALTIFFRTNLYGKAMRAVAENSSAAALAGIPVRWMLALSWVSGAVMAALAGMLLSPITGVYPAVGAGVLFPAFIVATLGGFESILGAAVGGALLGLIQTIAVVAVGGAFRDVVTFSAMLLLLLFRPTGLFGALRGREY